MRERIKILFVEDDKVDQMAFERFVKRENLPYDYVIAGSVLKAKDALAETCFDAALIDYFLSDGTAFDLFSEMGETPYVVITGGGNEEIAARAMKSGASDYLVKDLDNNYLTVLPVTVEKAMRYKQTEKELRQHQEHLEKLVEDRTAELTIANQQLVVEIAERVRAEEQIAASLKEKEVLLQEIHHRVKNNMQVINSLLNMEAARIQDEQIVKVLKDTQGRVRSMALVHERLYQSPNLAQVDFASYIQRLARRLFSLYKVDPAAITLHVDAEDVSLGIDAGIPCGLLLNELISNSLKYAFPGDRSGEVSVELRQKGEEVSLVVSDDGVGLPADLDWRNADSLGLQLLTMLTDQLDGEVELDRRGGTSFTITFGAAQRE